MPDMIVRLYDLPDKVPVMEALEAAGVVIARAVTDDKALLQEWLKGDMEAWQVEVARSFATDPATCFVAKIRNRIVGFAAYDVACNNFFGPTGVDEQHRGLGIGTGLLLTTLYAQQQQGYAYAIVGGVGPAEFYERVVDAQLIANSTPGIYPS